VRYLVILLAVVLGGCSGAAQSETPRQSAASLTGTYTWRADVNRYQYSDAQGVERILAAYPRDQLLLSMVECLDDATPSKSTFDGNPIAVGAMCYEVLSNLVYYEPTTATWPGYVSPKASLQQMRDAKAAWAKVVRSKAFNFQ
jgi:uncharacterized protein YceK